MAKRGISAFGELFSLFGSAIAVSRALENGGRPRSGDLRRLGIDPAEFRRIRRY